jgi:hypothetical protein
MRKEACPELAVALSPFGYAQGKLRRRDSRRAEVSLSHLLNTATPKPSKENFGHRPAMAFYKKG